MHLGHRALLARALEMEERVALVTFEPRPAEFLAPTRAPPRLQSIEQRVRVCRAMGVDAIATVPFDRTIASLDPEAFIDEILLEGLRPSAVVVGEDFRFGRDRAGDTDTLSRRLSSRSTDFAVVAERCMDDGIMKGEKIGSTRIRGLVDQGEMGMAAEQLGRWYSVSGSIGRGQGRGRPLGFPTANLTATDNLLPLGGVYAAWLSPDPGHGTQATLWPAVANLGTNPTFAGDVPAPRLEVHVLDRDLGDTLYNTDVEVFFTSRLRDEIRFDGVDALRTAVDRDIVTARSRLDTASQARCWPEDLRPSRERGAEHA
jgi:riboflavin kinase/FMN adenylyltransferase